MSGVNQSQHCDLIAAAQGNQGGFCIPSGTTSTTTELNVGNNTGQESDFTTTREGSGGQTLNVQRKQALELLKDHLPWFASDHNRATNVGSCFTYGNGNNAPTQLVQLASDKPGVIRA
jgi:hypothetical protein